MSIKNILVAYNGTQSSDAAVGMALLMAKKYDAHVTGILAHGMPQFVPTASAWLTKRTSEQINEIVDRVKGEVYGAIAGRFGEITAGSGRDDKVHWIDILGGPDTTIVEIARCFDITLLGEFTAVPGEEQLVLHPDVVALQSGRPVLVIPKDYKVAALGGHAVFAWDGKRAAARAMSDAMQILESKTLVTILTIGEDTPKNGIAGADISAHLARHGIPTEWARLPQKGSIGATIADYCGAHDAGLLVMGAYEHSKFSEDLIGGVTNDVFKKIAIPVLMSH
jgi:nucleotide-binding universal stress UspA family protein